MKSLSQKSKDDFSIFLSKIENYEFIGKKVRIEETLGKESNRVTHIQFEFIVAKIWSRISGGRLIVEDNDNKFLYEISIDDLSGFQFENENTILIEESNWNRKAKLDFY